MRGFHNVGCSRAAGVENRAWRTRNEAQVCMGESIGGVEPLVRGLRCSFWAFGRPLLGTLTLQTSGVKKPALFSVYKKARGCYTPRV